jgi:hypothetical protein
MLASSGRAISERGITVRRRVRFVTVVLPFAVSVAAALALPATSVATPSQPFTGSTLVTLFAVTSSTDAGPNMIVEYVATLSSSGTFTGTYSATARQVVHPDGTAEDHANYTATGTTPCGTGSFTIVENAKFDSSGNSVGHFTTIDNSTNTARIHADVDFVFNGTTGAATVSGTYHCV